MHIILLSNRLASTRTLAITPYVAATVALVFLALAFSMSFLFSWVGIRLNLPFAETLVVSVQQEQTQKTEEFVRDNLNVMAAKLGQMQAQLLQLDSLGERISTLSGVKMPEKAADGKVAKGGQGGPLVLSTRPLSPLELQRAVDLLEQSVEQRSDTLTVLESQLMERRIKSSLLPSISPISGDYVGSSFGSRLDPIAGVSAFHEGVDFVTDPGTQVVASAGGVVVSAEYHAQYGNLIEIDHGNEFSTRYAHLSKILVSPGQVIKRGQKIAASGNTGRSTGPHLHFEVRFKGVAQNPARFLHSGAQLASQTPNTPAVTR